MNPAELALIVATVAAALTSVIALAATRDRSAMPVPESGESDVDLQRAVSQFTYFQQRSSEELQERLRELLAEAVTGDAQTRLLPPRTSQLVREIGHSLGTPLAGIKANVVLLRDSLDSDNVASRGRLEHISEAVDLCQVFLLSYRNLGRLDDRTGFLSKESLQDLVEKAIDFYAEAFGKGVVYEVTVPTRIPNRSSYQVLAALLPLIENAVEGISRKVLRVEYLSDAQEGGIRIENAVDASPPKNFMEDGVTSKDPTNHKGLGIGISQRLVNAMGGSLAIDASETRFVAIVRFRTGDR